MPTSTKKKIWRWAPVVLAVTATLAVVLYATKAVFPVLAIWICVSVLRFLGVGGSERRALWFNIGFSLAVLTAVLKISTQPPPLPPDAPKSERFRFGPHEILGYAPDPNQVARIVRYDESELIYDVVYSIDENGLRIAPPQEEGAAAPCILFFGGSFMFGEGVRDDETLPYRIGVAMGGSHRVYNFGYMGYGPHQMLAALQRGLVDSIIECRPSHVVYLAALFQIPRAAGLSIWDRHGPYYEVVDRGRVEYRGAFDEVERPSGWFSRMLEVSGVQEQIPGLHPAADGHDYDRYIGILSTTRDHVAANYPNAKFHVLYWDEPRAGLFPIYLFDWSRPPLEVGLEEAGLRVIRASEILEDLETDLAKYELHEADGHPNAMAHSELAAHLARALRQGATLRRTPPVE